MGIFNKRKTPKIAVENNRLIDALKQEQDHDNALMQSVVLIGPQDVGKSVLAKNFAKKYDLLYINMEEARFCSTDVNHLKSNVRSYSLYSKQTKSEARNSVAKRYAQYANIERANLAYRKAFPNVPNYQSLGYDSLLLSLLEKIKTFKEDEICSYMYKKQFDDAIIKSIAKQITTPCVIDMTTEGPIRLTKEYKKRVPLILADYEQNKNEYKELTHYLEKHNLDIKEILNLPKESDATIINCIKSFNNIITLQYPAQKTPKLDFVNQNFLNSGQYEKLANNNVVVADFIEKDSNGCSKLNKQKLTECMDIMASVIYDHNPDIFKTQKEIELAF